MTVQTRAQQTGQTEQDSRVRLLNSLLTASHGNKSMIRKAYEEVCKKDPILFGHFVFWYSKHGKGDLRDSQESLTACLLKSDLSENREAGFVYLQSFPPYQVAHIVRDLKGWVDTRTVSARRRDRYEASYGGKVTSLGTFEVPGNEENKTLTRERIREAVGPFQALPRSTRTAVRIYVRDLEANANRFDGAVLAGREGVKYLYSAAGIRPSSRAQAILFDDNPPEGSRAYGLKVLAMAGTPEEKARIMVQNAIPWRTAIGALAKGDLDTPMVLAAVVNSMSPQEILKFTVMLDRHGATANPDIQQLINEKLGKGKSDKRVSAFTGRVAAEAARKAGVSAEIVKKLEEVTEGQIETKGHRIIRPTALFTDKSGSMDRAIELSRHDICPYIARIMESGVAFYAYAFDTVVYPLTIHGSTLSDFERTYSGIIARNATCCGGPFREMIRKGEVVEQVIIVTDENENREPLFHQAYQEYAQAMGVNPHVVIIKVRGSEGTSDLLERNMAGAGIPFDVLDFQGDYYNLPALGMLLSRPSLRDLLQEVLDVPLPTRAEWEAGRNRTR